LQIGSGSARVDVSAIDASVSLPRYPRVYSELTSMRRDDSSMTESSPTTAGSPCSFSSSNVSQMDTPSTEFSCAEDAFDRCSVGGCRTKFTGETLDVRKGNYKRHMKFTHGSKRYYCIACESHYNRDDNLRNHMRREHPDLCTHLGILPAKKRRVMKREGTGEVM
jgi:hypothetical protein